ncbi:claudin-6 isoform X1 [Panthera pardus]|uniref:Claudin n=1 Tax=Panthera pardus TaxID=9691 RepID=A0A9V1GJW0_PANPR|nr:claudin-6 isoform X1 [Panthera pardus]XP_058568146.1 claudin-6 isoform X1 [Neofelis nebulosa]
MGFVSHLPSRQPGLGCLLFRSSPLSLNLAMASAGLQILGIILTLLGWVNALVSCALPLWKVTAFIGNSIVVAQVVWEGLWMSCVVQSTGQMQCKVYDSLLALPQDLQAARALCVVALLLALLGLLVYLAGAKCTTCVEDKDSKARLVLVSGIIFVISGVLTLIPVCWTAHTIIRDFYNPLVAEAQKRELGASLYLGWAASGLLLLGGGLLCCTCPSGGARGSNHYMARYSASAAHGTSQGPSEYPAKNYV